MRVVSVVPAGTEIAYALGALGDVVAVTHDSDHPAEVRMLPQVSRSTIPPSAGSREIDTAVRDAAARGENTFHLDSEALAAARPDVILGQTLCNVCAVTIGQLPATIAGSPTVVPLDGHGLAGIFDDVVRAGEALGRRERAVALVASLKERIERVRSAVRDEARPTVVCLEWLDPLFNAGHWVPEQVEIAGGTELCARSGAPSTTMTPDDLVAADPDFVFLMPCGFDAARAVRESVPLVASSAWRGLRAVRSRNVYALDGNAYFSRPGPRVVDGIELLASLLHPGRFHSSLPAIRLGA
jgi:iron complex transport system substrate-binding protein